MLNERNEKLRDAGGSGGAFLLHGPGKKLRPLVFAHVFVHTENAHAAKPHTKCMKNGILGLRS